MINNFISNRTNLTIIQCILYFVIGWIMGEYLTWTKLIIMFIILLGIQTITHVKAVSDGMVFSQFLNDNPHFKRMIDKMQKDSEEE